MIEITSIIQIDVRKKLLIIGNNYIHYYQMLGKLQVSALTELQGIIIRLISIGSHERWHF